MLFLKLPQWLLSLPSVLMLMLLALLLLLLLSLLFALLLLLLVSLLLLGRPSTRIECHLVRPHSANFSTRPRLPPTAP